VISDQKDYEYSKAFLTKVPDNIQIIFQPAWGSDYRILAESVLKDRLRVRVMGQLHKMIWGEVPGK
jgi:7-carboxy-7-deazaguanine synthase